MTIHISVLIYFYINCFIAGWIASEERGRFVDRADKVIWILTIIWMITFAIPTFIIAILWGDVLKPVSVFLQLDFWWRYFFTTSLYNLKEEELAQLNASTIIYRKEDNIKNRIYKYCTELVNKRNNYIHFNQTKENGE